MSARDDAPAADAGPQGGTRRGPGDAGTAGDELRAGADEGPAGRAAEWRAARQALAGGPGVLVTGAAGMGTSALLTALAADWAAATGGRVLRCAPHQEDAGLPYLGLTDLLDAVPADVVDTLPDGCRPALRAALLDRALPDGGHDALAVRRAFLEVLRRLARRGPLLVVADGLQWLDGPTADLLGFAARRLDGTGVRVAAGERVPPGGLPEGAALCPPGTAEVPLRPLDGTVVEELIAAAAPRLRPAARRAVREAAAGNPLYAGELARATARTGEPGAGRWWDADGDDDFGLPVAVPPSLRRQLLAGADTLSTADRRVLLLCAAAERPALSLLRAAGVHRPAARLAAAERLGLLAPGPSGAVRFRHPVLRAALYAAAAPGERRRAHGALADAAGAAGEPVARARHLALAHPYPDGATAAALESAAGVERARGAAGLAARLAALAARRTPATDVADRWERWTTAAEHARDAGLPDPARHMAYRVLAGSTSARHRVRARLVLLGTAGQAVGGAKQVIEDGLRDAAGEPQLEAWLHHWAAVAGLLSGEVRAAERHAGAAARSAARAGDVRAWTAALAALARVRALTGRTSAAEDALERAAGAAGRAAGPVVWAPARMRAVLALDADRVAEARERTARLLEAVAGGGSVEERLAALVVRVRVQVRTGECRQAVAAARECAALAGRMGGQSSPAWYAVALAAVHTDPPDAARRAAARAVAACEADGDLLFLPRALAVLGLSGLLAGDAAGAVVAVEALRRVKEIGDGMRAADPPALHWLADLTEALVMLGEHHAAAEVVREGHRRAGAGAPVSVRAALERAEGLLAAAIGHAAEGAARLRSSVGLLRESALPLELARSLVALGAVERRGRHRPAAREALTRALRLADVTGASALERRAREELARLDAGERGGAPVLTPAEARIAELVGRGATNREVAAELFISVKTVEGTLSRVYRKVGVRSRTALSRALTAPGG